MAPSESEVHEREDVCALPLVRRLAAMLDRDPDAVREGDPLPHGWHVIMFTVDTPQSQLRADGMAGTGVPLPDVDLPRVVMGGRRLQFAGDIPIGSRVLRRSRVGAVVPKDGRSGRLVIVTMRNELFVDGAAAPAISEEQDYVFREEAREEVPAAAPATTAARATAERPQPDVTRELVPDETLLFRYCAITYNPHRIHFDHPYTVEHERYPALVVNGGLSLLYATELFRSEAGREPTSITTRNTAPLFCNETMHVCALRGEPAWQVWVENPRGEVALEGRIA